MEGFGTTLDMETKEEQQKEDGGVGSRPENETFAVTKESSIISGLINTISGALLARSPGRHFISTRLL